MPKRKDLTDGEVNDIPNTGYYLNERKCPVCGKIFVPAPFHVFVEDHKTFCKWSCLCEYRRKKATKAEKRRVTHKHRRRYTKELKAEVMRMITEKRKTMKDVAAEFGLNYHTVNSWAQAYREGRMKL